MGNTTEQPLEDQDVFEELIKPFLEKENLPTDSAFVERLSRAFIEASVELVKFRKERALGRLNDKL